MYPPRHGAADATAHHHCTRKGGWVYIMTKRRNGTLHLGVTSDLARRAWEHREGSHIGKREPTAS